MPSYSYIAKTFSGEKKTGILEAKNEHDLARVLRQEGYVLISAESDGKINKKRKFRLVIPFFNNVSLPEKMIFTRNLQVMISAGISLPRALNTIASQTKSRKLKNALLGISEEITKGRSFSDALSEYLNIFSEVFASMVKVGEEAGTLEEVLGILTKQMERKYELESKIKGALIYPAVIIIAMIGIGVAMLILVVPKLADTFRELNIELPLTTRIVVASGTLLAKFWYLLPIGIFLFIMLLRIILRTTTGKLIFDSLFLKIPIISSIIIKTNSAYTVRTLGSLIASGVPIVRSLEITAGTLGNIYYKRAMTSASEQMKKGAKLSQLLDQYRNIYPSVLIQMMAVGEETGQMANMLQKLADFFEEEVANTTKNLSAVIEPVLMLIIGAVVGFFAISMIQPMYSMIQTL